MGKVVLVGAGPGDPGLITQRGMEQIAACDVLLYDHLVGKEILSYAREDCILIDVGKRSGGVQALPRVTDMRADAAAAETRQEQKSPQREQAQAAEEYVCSIQENLLREQAQPAERSSCTVQELFHAGERSARAVREQAENAGLEAQQEGRGRTVAQEETCALMIALARKYDLVVRLKGGDPFVFGRGYEETEALRNAKVSYEIVPGITAAVAAAECAGIPLTHRGVSRSFHVVAGHRMDDEALNESELKNLAQAEGTLVFLMAVKNLEAICEGLILHGKAADTPAAVVENGSLPAQRRIDGTLQSVAERARAAGTVSPAVLVVGETAQMDFRANFFGEPDKQKQPGLHADISHARRTQKINAAAKDIPVGTEPILHEDVCAAAEPAPQEVVREGTEPVGQKIYAVGTADTLRRFRQIAAGYSLQVCPILELEPVLTEEYNILLSAVGRMEEYAWVLFVSRQAVRIFGQALRDCRTDVRRLAGCRFAVNSASVKRELEKLGIQADFVSESPYSAAFAAEFAEFLKETVRAAGTEQAVPATETVHAAKTAQAAEITKIAEEKIRPGRASSGGKSAAPPRILLLRAKQGTEELEKGLAAKGLQMDVIRAYDVRIRTEDRADEAYIRTGDRVDDLHVRTDEKAENAAEKRAEEPCAFGESLEKAIKRQGASFVFLSASGVRAFAKVLQKKQLHFPAGAVYYCMGPRTQEALLSAYAQSEASLDTSSSAYAQSEASFDTSSSAYAQSETSFDTSSSAYAQSEGSAETPQIPGPEAARIPAQEELQIHIPKPCTLQGLAEEIRNLKQSR